MAIFMEKELLLEFASGGAAQFASGQPEANREKFDQLSDIHHRLLFVPS